MQTISEVFHSNAFHFNLRLQCAVMHIHSSQVFLTLEMERETVCVCVCVCLCVCVCVCVCMCVCVCTIHTSVLCKLCNFIYWRVSIAIRIAWKSFVQYFIFYSYYIYNQLSAFTAPNYYFSHSRWRENVCVCVCVKDKSSIHCYILLLERVLIHKLCTLW